MKGRAKKIIKRIVNTVLTVIVVILVLLIAAGIYSKATGKMIFSRQVLWVLSGSMEDAIPARSYILVKEVDAKDVNVGDVITFYSRDPMLNRSLNSHRVIEIKGDHETFVTKGDNNPAPDEYEVYAEDVVARYERNLPVLSVLGRLYATSGGLVVMFGIIIGGVILWFALGIMRRKKSAQEAENEKQAEIQRMIAEELEHLRAGDVKPEDLMAPFTPPSAKAANKAETTPAEDAETSGDEEPAEDGFFDENEEETSAESASVPDEDTEKIDD